MSSISNVRKTVEAGILLVTVSTLLLVGCGGGGSTASAGNSSVSNPYVSALTDGIGLRSLIIGYGAASSVAMVVTASANSTGSYTMATDQKKWSGSAWQANTPVVSRYLLNSSGSWIDDTVNPTFTSKADGAITTDGETETWVDVDLTNANMKTGKAYNLVDPAISGGSAVLNVGAMPGIASTSATYPNGSVTWIGIKKVYALDLYGVWAGLNISTPTGNLTSLSFNDANTFSQSHPMCFLWGSLVYSATQPTTPNTARFDLYQGACAAIPAGATIHGTVDLTYKTVRTQSIALFSNATDAVYGSWVSKIVGPVVMPTIMAEVNGSVLLGRKIPAGTNVDALMINGFIIPPVLLNKTAMDAVTTEAGMQSF